MTIGGAVVGGSMVMVANQMKQAYQNAGGGLAGLQAGAKAFGLGAISGGQVLWQITGVLKLG